MTLRQSWPLRSSGMSFLPFQLGSSFPMCTKRGLRPRGPGPRERQGHPWQREGWMSLSWLPLLRDHSLGGRVGLLAVALSSPGC